MSDNNEMVTISKKVYDRLLDSEKMLRALQMGGVDNWEWYGDSLRDAGYFEDEDDED